MPYRQRRLSIEAEQHEIIDVTAIVRDAQIALDEMVKRVEIDQRKKLAEQVSDGNARGLAVIGKRHHHINKPAIFDFQLNLLAQDIAVDAVEKLSNVEFQGVAIGRRRPQSGLREIGGFVRAIANAAGKRLIYKPALKDLAGHGIDCVLHNQVAKSWRKNAAGFGLVNHKAVIRTRPVASIGKLTMERVKIAGQVLLEDKTSTLSAFVTCGSMKCRQQRGGCKCLFKQVAYALHIARPSRPAMPALPEKRKHSDFAVEQTTRRKVSPLIPLRSCDP